jgi:hypothetical protein
MTSLEGEMLPAHLFLTCVLNKRNNLSKYNTTKNPTLHRVGRVLNFSPVVGIGTPPTPHPQASVPPPLFGSGGGAHSLAREGGGRVPIPTRGHTLCYSLYICTLCYAPLIGSFQWEIMADGKTTYDGNRYYSGTTAIDIFLLSNKTVILFASSFRFAL